MLVLAVENKLKPFTGLGAVNEAIDLLTAPALGK